MGTSTETPRSEDEPNAFARAGLCPALLDSVERLGFEEPTPIQAEAIPPLLQGRDVIGRARTGSGKTAAFGLPLLQALNPEVRGVQALVLTPTRELALQVTEAIRSFAGRGGPGVVAIYGGASYTPQLRALRAGVPVVVGTPGRVIDHLERGSLDLSGLGMLVLDEADEMLRMGFIEDVEKVLEASADDRQVALFSATMPDPIRRVANKHLSDPVLVQVEGRALTVDHIEQRWLRVPQRHKLEALIRVLAAEERGATLVFARTRADCGALAEELGQRGLGVDALHGDLGQAARERVLGRMRDGRLDVLVATDVASRGLDVEHITHVINFDLPTDAEVYVHRIGRTGRAGRAGTAISFVTPKEVGRIRMFGKRVGCPIPQAKVPSDAEVAHLRQRRLRDGLGEALQGAGQDALRGWIQGMVDDEGWDPVDVAAAAVRLLTEPGGVLDLDPDTRPPAWAGPQNRPAPRDRQRPDRRPSGHHDGPPPGGGGDEVELFFAAGRSGGVRPADIVGALANEAGIPGAWIGRISIHDRKSFAGLPREVAERLLAAGTTLNIRGSDVRMAIAQPNMPGRNPDQNRRPRRKPHPSRRHQRR